MSSAKHGIAGLTKTVALEVATFGITVNCICPGYVWTPLVEKQIPDTMKARNMTDEQVKHDVLLAAQPTKQFVTVDQVAALARVPVLATRPQITGANSRSTAAGPRSEGRRSHRAVTGEPQAGARPASGPQDERKKINLALQGGGAHGAFTWGVLDHLLEDGRLTIEGISGTSAGAMNAVMLADGLARGGAAGSAEAAGRLLARGEPRRQPATVQRRCWTGCSRSCR